ncbi:MAG: hypothetical protein GY833_22625 [Aestuariibacter sp.]|nr:hypothetical protein [Aestuariibacter sp.]|tara:strand:- start:236775 stop:237173 length:399 start_codon:yes stop_codon:yes gene_type:complete
MDKKPKHIVAEHGVGTVFLAVPTGNRVKRGSCPFSQAVELKVIKAARVNAEFEIFNSNTKSHYTEKLKLHSFHLSNVFDGANGGYTLYPSHAAMNDAYRVNEADKAIRDWSRLDDETKLKVADILEIASLEA